MFRNESERKASELIIEAVRATVWKYGAPPALGMITFVDPKQVAGTFVRIGGEKVLTWGYSFQKAGFEYDGWTKGGLFVLRLKAEKITESEQPMNTTRSLFA